MDDYTLPTRIVVACDKYKGNLSALQVCNIIRDAIIETVHLLNEKVDVIINPLPAPAILGPNPVCQSADNSTEIYSTVAAAGSTYNWTVSGGTLSGQGTNEIAVRWTTPGPGSVSVTETIISTGCTATATIDITVQPAPVTNGIFHN